MRFKRKEKPTYIHISNYLYDITKRSGTGEMDFEEGTFGISTEISKGKLIPYVYCAYYKEPLGDTKTWQETIENFVDRMVNYR